MFGFLTSLWPSYAKPNGTLLVPYRAVCYGINAYPQAPLHGCVNDSDDWAQFLVRDRGFTKSHVKVLHDGQAAKENVLQAWSWAVEDVQPGQLVVLSLSGHGAQVPCTGGDERDGLDEVLCMSGFSFDDPNTFISDDEIGNLFTSVPDGALVVMLADCCHSGGAARYLGPTPRRIPRPRASLQAQWVRSRIGSRAARPGDPRNLLVFAGCGENEYCYDTVWNGRPCGAFTRTALQVLSSWSGRKLSWLELSARVNRMIGEPQHPCILAPAGLPGLQCFSRAR